MGALDSEPRPIPCCDAYGLFPGRAPPGLGAEDLGDCGLDSGAWGACAVGASAFGAGAGVDSALGAAAGAASSLARAGLGAAWPGLGPDDVAGRSPAVLVSALGWDCWAGLALGVLLGAFSAGASPEPAGNAVRSFLATGGSTVEDAPRTNSPNS